MEGGAGTGRHGDVGIPVLGPILSAQAVDHERRLTELRGKLQVLLARRARRAMVGAKGEARGTEAHFHGEAEGQAGVGGTEQECAGMAGGPLPSGMSGGGVWSRRGVWGNALVRDRGGDVDAVPDRRKAARLVTHLKVSHGNQVTLNATREQENWEAVGGLRNPALAVARVPGLRDAGRRVRASLEEYLDMHPDLLVDVTECVERGKDGIAEERIGDLAGQVARAIGARPSRLGHRSV